MQVDIKTSSVTQLRHTFSNVARRLGGDKPASRYQEATFDLQPEVNFHYRPLWEPERELYDKRRTALVMKDWYAFKDPRQFYYGTYTITRSRQQETVEKNIDFVEKRGLLKSLPEAVLAKLAFVMVPLRHVEWGANANNCSVTAYAYGTAITQATMFHAMDRLGIAQYLSRIGLLIDGNSGDALSRGKDAWMDDPAWQGLRRCVENMMVVQDPIELYLAQNLVLDGLLYPLVYQRHDVAFATAHGPGLSMVTEFMSNWFEETSRWIDATVKTAAQESPENAALLSGWFRTWSDQAVQALRSLAEVMFDQQAATAIDETVAVLNARAAKLGLRVEAGVAA